MGETGEPDRQAEVYERCLDDDEQPNTADDQLPQVSPAGSIQVPEQNEFYMDFSSGEDLGKHFMAARCADGNVVSLEAGELGSLVFDQMRDPNDYKNPDKNGFFKLIKDPWTRPPPLSPKLVFYGYDIYHAWQFGNEAIACYCMIMEDGLPTGNILLRIAKTRCVKPRVDGFVYNIREKKCYRVINIRIFMKNKWTKPADFNIDFKEMME